IYAAAAGLVNHGVPAAYADEPYPLHLLGVIRSPSEQAEQMADQAVQRAYSKYGVVPSILAAPFYAVARVTGPGPQLPAQAFPYENRALPLVPLLLNPLLAAATAALLFQVARALGYRRHGALVATLAFACGSLAWPYSKTLLNMTPAGLFLLASFWCVLRTVRGMAGEAPHPDVAPASTGVVPSQVANTTREPAEAVANVPPSRAGRAGEGAPRRGPGPGRGLGLLSAGAFAGLAIATRYEALLFAAPIAAWCGWPGREGLLAGRSLRRLARFTAGLAAVAVPLVLGLNLLRTGSPFDAGYGGEGTLASLAAKPWYGWFGILLSPGCGLVPHTPLMALGIVALAWFWEDARGPALVSGAVVLLAIAYYGSLTTTWCAFATWGPRYFVAVAPFMALPLAALWQRLAGAGRNPFVWLFGGGLLLWSAGTNLLAVLIDFNRGWQDHWAQGVTYLETSWVPFFSGITSHFRLFREWLLDGRGGLDLYLLYAAGPLGPVLVWCLIAAGVALLASVWIARESDESERT
ncbi:MAG: hypothetical protein ACRDI2_14050, partial [Chloroflexota bacterium]